MIMMMNKVKLNLHTCFCTPVARTIAYLDKLTPESFAPSQTDVRVKAYVIGKPWSSCDYIPKTSFGADGKTSFTASIRFFLFLETLQAWFDTVYRYDHFAKCHWV